MGFQRKGDNFYISFYSWKKDKEKELQEQLGDLKHAKDQKLCEETKKWEIPQNFKTKRRKSDTTVRVKAVPKITKSSNLTALCSAVQNIAFTYETEDSLDTSPQIPKYIFHSDTKLESVKVNRVRTKFAKEQRNASPKYFCKQCRQDVCKDCFQHTCISHHVEWMGNKHFRCVSPFHLNEETRKYS